MTPVDSAGPRIMWSISQIAERDGVSRQSVSKQVQEFVADHDLPVERDGRGRITKVSLPHYDHLQDARPFMEKLAVRFPDETPDETARRQCLWLMIARKRRKTHDAG
ncbi:hypothetical protein [Paracoccus sp. (in: a-proteobacteria)]|uniref:hypothetical protein n=1 Tax=Paracoccus sp. TaxID=267 RepID=UPI002AFF950A|nr:hypothetical protein [Paracoccus sp. (in: a-proteobacteria)]